MQKTIRALLHVANQRPASARSRHRGFTLLELLVVLLIIGLISTFAVLSTGLANRDAELKEEADRLIALMRLASEEAILRTEQLALEIRPDGYRFFTYRETKWEPVEEELFRERAWIEELDADLVLEGRPIVLGEQDEEENGEGEEKKSPRYQPQIMFLSSGEMTAFELILNDARAHKRYIIKGAPTGTVILDTGAED